jgi:hypothetical protein
MKEMLAKVDQFELDALKMVDAFISRTGFNVPFQVAPHKTVFTNAHFQSSGASVVHAGACPPP